MTFGPRGGGRGATLVVLNMNVYSPYNMHDNQMDNATLNQLDSLICDSNSGRVLTELSHWSMLLEVNLLLKSVQKVFLKCV